MIISLLLNVKIIDMNIEINKHKNYEILNLIGYGLAKFDMNFVEKFGFKSKSEFYGFLVSKKIADTVGTIKNRQDLFDPFFENGRKGWWQKGNTYLHRKLLIDNLFGDLDNLRFSEIVKVYINKNFDGAFAFSSNTSPIVLSKFKKLQETGLDAELYFLKNYHLINLFSKGEIQDARLFGDGYDFQIETPHTFYLTEIKGVRNSSGSIRLTNNEYKKAQEYKKDYVIVVVSNLESFPKFTCIENPVENLILFQKEIISNQTYFHSKNLKW